MAYNSLHSSIYADFEKMRDIQSQFSFITQFMYGFMKAEASYVHISATELTKLSRLMPQIFGVKSPGICNEAIVVFFQSICLQVKSVRDIIY